MSKRHAGKQINPNDMNSGSDDESFDGPKVASSEILARRKIAVPASRLKSRPTATPANPSTKPNPFAAFASPAAPSTVNTPVAPSSTTTPSNVFAGLSASTAATTPVSSVTSAHSSEQLRTRGLNTAFHAQIVKAMASSSFENWTEMCQKYINYAKTINHTPEATKPEAAKPAATTLGTVNWPASYKEPETEKETEKEATKPAAINWPASYKEPEADKDSEKEAKPETTKPATVNWPTSYKEPEAEKDAKQAESKITATGFQFGGAASSATSFKFGDKQVEIGKSAQPSQPQGGFVFNPNGKGEIKFGSGNDEKLTESSAEKLVEKSAEKPAEKPAFFFGKPTEPAATESKAASESKPLFSFGKPATASANAESKESKPLFSFGKPAESSTSSFNFSQPPPAADKPSASAFSFGQQSSNKSGLSFGSNANPFGGAKVDATWKPSNPINFASSAAPASTTVASDATSTAASTAEPSGEPSDTPNDVQTDLGGPGPGEEDEDSIYEKKAKLFEQADGQYKSMGLGMLRVLRHRDTHKVRALLRAEGSGRVLLNIPIRKEFTYSTIGKGQVKLMDVKPGNQTPTIYLLRVKTEADGEELRTKLEENKN